MARPPGYPKSGGRTAGTPNKLPGSLRQDIMEKLEALGFDPIVELLRVNREAWKEYERSAEIYDAITDKRVANGINTPLNDTAPVYLKLASDSAKEVMQYVYPKRKSVELKNPDGTGVFQSFTDLVKQIADEKK